MAYEKQTWNDGDIITAEKLNHIEDGIEAAEKVRIVTVSSQNGAYKLVDSSYEQILQYVEDGFIVYCRFIPDSQLTPTLEGLSEIRIPYVFTDIDNYPSFDVGVGYDADAHLVYLLSVSVDDDSGVTVMYHHG